MTRIGDFVRICFNARNQKPAALGEVVRVSVVDQCGIRYWSGAGRRRFLWRAESWVRILP